MLTPNTMSLNQFEFCIEDAWFRYVAQSFAGPGWDFSFVAYCVNDGLSKPRFPDGILINTQGAPLPMSKKEDYVGLEIQYSESFYKDPILPCSFYESGNSVFELHTDGYYHVWGVRLTFLERNADQYLIRVAGCSNVITNESRFELLAVAVYSVRGPALPDLCSGSPFG